MDSLNNSREVLLTLSVILVLGLTGCKDGNNSGSETTPDPEITSVNPMEGPVGTSVTIEGSGFSSTASENEVSFNGTSADVSSATSSQIKTQVPEGATSGAVSVSVNRNTATGPVFTIEEAMPGIQSVEPDSGVVGTEITITGMNFSATASENTITFNGVTATVTSASETELVTTVPEGATDGPVGVAVDGKTATNSSFDVITSGTLEVIVNTTGIDKDSDGYVLSINGTDMQSQINDTISAVNLEEGSYAAELTGIASNCSLSGDNPRNISITPGETTSTIFEVSCREVLNNQIVYLSIRNSNSDIFVMNSDGSDPKNLTNDTASDIAPVISNDGTQIAFSSDRSGSFQIFLINADGSNLRQLTNSSASSLLPSWSPDDTKIAFSDNRTDGSQIYIINVDGTGESRITNNTGQAVSADWSPDGTRIVYSGNSDGDPELFLMNTDGTGVQQLTDNTVYDSNPRWSPDGSRIAFTSQEEGGDGGFRVTVMNADGTGIQFLTQRLMGDANPTWSPDGTEIAYTSFSNSGNDIFKIKADGTGTPINLTARSTDEDYPYWSPVQ